MVGGLYIPGLARPYLHLRNLSGNLLKSDYETAPNEISTLKESIFEDLNNLQSLDISWNNIQEISSDSFHGLTNLYSLKLSRNKINSIDFRSLNGLNTLNTLDLENNLIPTFIEMHL